MGYKIMKNKLAPPWRTGSLDLIYGQGYDVFSELISLCTDLGVVELNGSWYQYNDIKVQGSDKFKLILMEDYELKNKLEAQVREMLGLKPAISVSIKGE